jgi:hypothetical protein
MRGGYDGAIRILRCGQAACGDYGEGRSAGNDCSRGAVRALPCGDRGGGFNAGQREEERLRPQPDRRHGDVSDATNRSSIKCGTGCRSRGFWGSASRTAFRTARRCGCSERRLRRPVWLRSCYNKRVGLPGHVRFGAMPITASSSLRRRWHDVKGLSDNR